MSLAKAGPVKFEVVRNGGREKDGSYRTLSRWTFEYQPARRIVESHLTGRVLNATAGRTKLSHDGEIVRNDLNPEMDADTHLDVLKLADHFGPHSFDTVVFDPPYDEKQARTKYDGMHAKDVYGALREFNELVRPGGVVICFGWNSWGMRSFDDFTRSNVYLLQRGPVLRDVICTVDRRVNFNDSSLEDVNNHSFRGDQPGKILIFAALVHLVNNGAPVVKSAHIKSLIGDSASPWTVSKTLAELSDVGLLVHEDGSSNWYPTAEIQSFANERGFIEAIDKRGDGA